MKMKTVLLFILNASQLFLHGEPQQCQRHGALNKHGDVMLAGLFPIHLYNSLSKRYELNMHALAWAEAMIFAVNEINANRRLLRNISIGYTIHDTCNEIETAMKAVLDLMLDDESEASTVYPRDQNVKSAEISIHNATLLTTQAVKTKRDVGTSCVCRKTSKRILTLIGGASSKISASISNILSVDSVPQISYSSTSQDLSNKNIYPSFLRTIPPDRYQSEFIVDILEHYDWKYVNVLASDDEYGRVGVNHLLPLLLSKGICVGVLEIFGTVLKLDKMGKIMDKIIKEKQAKVTILWTGKQLARTVIAVAVKKSVHNNTWIATEAWGNDEELLNTDPRVVAGLFGVVSSMIPYPEFESSILNKPASDLKLYKLISKSLQNCSGSNSFNKSCNDTNLFNNAPQLSRDKISNVINAVYAFAYGLDSALEEASLDSIKLSFLLQSIKNTNLTGINGTIKMFDKNGDPTTALYSLVNLKKIQHGALKFQVILHWNSKNRFIEFQNSSDIFYSGDGVSVPQSKCGNECKPGFYAFRHTNKKCCWTCVKCPIDNYKYEKGAFQCRKCPADSISNANNTACIQLDEEYLKLQSAYGITLIITMLVGVIPCIISIISFVAFRDTPLVRSSNRGLSFLQLSTATLASLLPLLYIGIPSLPLCYARPLVFGVLFTVSNSIIFNKADRLLRIFKMRHRVLSGQILLSNKFQFFIVLVLASVSVLICLICFTESPPKLTELISRQNNNITIRCDNTLTPTRILLAYINIIAITCIVYTIKSRHLPRQYREKRYICLAMFVATLSWMAHIPVSFSNAPIDVKNFAFCLSAQIANGVLLVVIYGPKTWTILIHPEENTTTVVHRNKITGPLMSNSDAFVVPLSRGRVRKTEQKSISN